MIVNRYALEQLAVWPLVTGHRLAFAEEQDPAAGADASVALLDISASDT